MPRKIRLSAGFCATSVALGALALAAVTGAAEPPSEPTQVTPLLVSAEVPDAELLDENGEPTSLHAALGEGPALLVFYRGGW